MYRHKKIFNYSSPLHFTGEHDKPHELMDENSPLFLGFRTADWWKAFGKYEFQDINEVMKIFNHFELHHLVKPFVYEQSVNLLDNMTDIEVILTYQNDTDFDHFTESCIKHKISHGYIHYPVGATFDDKY